MHHWCPRPASPSHARPRRATPSHAANRGYATCTIGALALPCPAMPGRARPSLASPEIADTPPAPLVPLPCLAWPCLALPSPARPCLESDLSDHGIGLAIRPRRLTRWPPVAKTGFARQLKQLLQHLRRDLRFQNHDLARH